jgi:transitional endoplasmic reticulum ATPase
MVPIRPYEADDLGGVLELWERAGWLPVGHDGLTVDQAVELLRSDHGVALVAEADGKVVATAIGAVVGTLGWVYRLVVVREIPDGERLPQALLEQLEGRLAERGVRALAAVVRDGTKPHDDLERGGYRRVEGTLFLERTLPVDSVAPAALAELGGRMIPPGLWEGLRGMEEAKEIIERRVILPLERPELAVRHAVVPPKAIVLFGPPGTGKTTFAKGIASRLGWPFVEIEPAEIAGEGPAREAKLLAEVFGRVAELSSAVVFVDEVEDLASLRHEQRKVSPSVTNEFLKQIPRLREASRHLLVCATNAVRALDPAFLRPGRFDYVLPVGLPDPEARREIWRRYVEETTDEEVDLDALVAASELFTPADIEFAARKAAQRAFEREHFAGEGTRANTGDFLAAIAETKPSLSEKIVRSFNEDTEQFARY